MRLGLADYDAPSGGDGGDKETEEKEGYVDAVQVHAARDVVRLFSPPPLNGKAWKN